LVLAFFKGVFSAYVEVPFFIFTIVLATIISSLVLMIMGDETTLYLRNAVTPIRSFTFNEMSIINVVSLVGYFLICLFLFNFTSIGTKVKMIGGGKRSASQSGINVRNMTILTFLISAVGIAIAAFLLIIRVRTIGAATAGSTGTDVMIALVLGGMPISGGPKAKISAGLVGAITISFLNSALTILGLSSGTIQIIRGIVFIIVVLVASFSYRTKLLPR
jgi:ribose transport system permease protein